VNDTDLALKVLGEINSKILELEDTRIKNISAGRPTDYSDYKYVVGQLKGLQEARQILENIHKRLEDL